MRKGEVSTEEGGGPLRGLHVLEIAHYIAGPHCAMLLGDHGADVIKVEPVNGEPGRKAPPHDANGDSLYFACHNRGKRSISLDLTRPTAEPVLTALLRWADVVVTNYSLGVPEKLGFGFERLSQINERAVLLHITGFGSWTQRRDYVAFDGVIQAMSGFAHMTGVADGPPTLSQVLVADHAAAGHAAFAVLCAMTERERTGMGRLVEVSMLDVLTSTLAHFLPAQALLGTQPTRTGSRSATRFVNIFDSADGPVYLAPITPKMWAEFCRILGHPEWAAANSRATPEYVTNAQLRLAIEEETQKWLLERSATEAVAVLQAGGIASGVVSNVAQVYQDGRADESRAMRLVRLPGSGDDAPVPGPSFEYPGESADIGSIPALGADTKTILAELGLSGCDVSDFIVEESVAGADA